MQICLSLKALKRTLSRFRPIFNTKKKADTVAFCFSLIPNYRFNRTDLGIAMWVSGIGSYLETAMPVKNVSAGMLGTETFVNAAEVYAAMKVIRNAYTDDVMLTWDARDEAGCIFRNSSGVNPTSYFIARAPSETFPDVNAESLCHVVHLPFETFNDACAAVRYAAAKSRFIVPLHAILVAAVDAADATDVVACNKSQLAITRMMPGIPYSILLPLAIAENLHRFFGKPTPEMFLEIAMTTPSSPASLDARDSQHREVRLRHGETTLYLAEGKPSGFPPYTALLPQFSAGAAVRFEVSRDVLTPAIRALNVGDTHHFFMLIADDAIYLWKQFKDKSPDEIAGCWFKEPLTNVSYRPGSETYRDTIPGLPEAGFLVRCDAARLCASLEAQPEQTVLCWLRLPASQLCFVNEAVLTSEVAFNKRDAAAATLGMLACG